jgi:hypothetical protein
MSAWADRSPEIDQIAASLVKALGEMHDLPKTQTANAGKYAYSYATLADALQQARPVFAKHGLAITQTATTTDNEVRISTTVIHASGQYLTARPIGMPVGKTAQETGSAVSYGRRYSLMAVLGLATEDDDGASAAPRIAREAPRIAQEPRKAPPRTSTPEEAEIRNLLASIPSDPAARIRGEFKAHFMATLKELPSERHGEALEWVQNAVSAWEHDQTLG